MIQARGRALIAALVAGFVGCAVTSERARADEQVAEGTVGDTTQLPDERASGVCVHIDLEAVAAYGIHKVRRNMLMYYINRKFYEVMADRIFDIFDFNRAAVIRKMDLVDCDKVQHVANDQPVRDRLRAYMLHMQFDSSHSKLEAICVGVSVPPGEVPGVGNGFMGPFGTSQPVTRTIDGGYALWSPCFDRGGNLTGFRALGIAE